MTFEVVPDGEDAPMEDASEFDRRYFEEHPGEGVYYRERIPGEWGKHEQEVRAAYVRVTQVRLGYRTREPVNILWPGGVPGDAVIDIGASLS